LETAHYCEIGGEGWECVVSFKLRRFYSREGDSIPNKWEGKWTPAQDWVNGLDLLDKKQNRWQLL
jgi:hypothetical protein